jgi:hypothetical protein
MFKRALIALIITGVSLLAIDWTSSAIFCGLEQKLSTIRDYRFCPYSGGIILSGFKTIADFKLEEWTAFGTIATAVFSVRLRLRGAQDNGTHDQRRRQHRGHQAAANLTKSIKLLSPSTK